MSATFPCQRSACPLTPHDRTMATYRHLALWTLQGWIAMFFIGAGYAKLTEPMANLVALLRWPALVGEPLVRGSGAVEVILALCVLAPLISWRIGRPLLLMSAASLVVLEGVMLAVHVLEADAGLAFVNALLLAITVPVLAGRRVNATRESL